MLQKYKFSLAGFFVLLVMCTIPASAAAATDQWFPDVGTICKYQLFAEYRFANGTQLIDSNFDVFYYSSQYYISPTIANLIDPTYTASWVKNGTFTELYMTNTYTEKDSTTLTRTTTISSNTTNFENYNLNLVSVHKTGYAAVISWTYKQMDLQKLSFPPHNGHNFPDYIDASKNLHENVNENYDIMFKTEEQIMAVYISSETINRTIISNGEGKVRSVIWSQTSSEILLERFSYRFELIEEPIVETTEEQSLFDRIFNQDWLVVGVMLVISLTIGLLLGKRIAKK